MLFIKRSLIKFRLRFTGWTAAFQFDLLQTSAPPPDPWPLIHVHLHDIQIMERELELLRSRLEHLSSKLAGLKGLDQINKDVREED